MTWKKRYGIITNVDQVKIGDIIKYTRKNNNWYRYAIIKKITGNCILEGVFEDSIELAIKYKNQSITGGIDVSDDKIIITRA